MSSLGLNESKVRDNLIDNLQMIEHGLVFIEKEKYIPSHLCTASFIDILARDKHGRYVLIEVKKTRPATRETLHEILKYVEAIKDRLGLREHELRIIIASVEWEELIIPFSSFVSRVEFNVQGFVLIVDDLGNLLSASIVAPVQINSNRVLSPWHQLSFYFDENSLSKGIESYEYSCKNKSIESYLLIVLDCPEGHPNGFPSSKQISTRRRLASMFQAMGEQNENSDIPLYRHAIYFAMQRLSVDEYVARFPTESDTRQIALDIIESTEGDETLCCLQDELLCLSPQSRGDFVEIGYAAKFRGRLIEEEGWRVSKVLRYGAFSRNVLISDETLLKEIGGSLGLTGQHVDMRFHPNNKAEVAELRNRIDECLADNAPWREQTKFVIEELVNKKESRECRVWIVNNNSGLTTLYLVSTRDDGFLYVPTYHIDVPAESIETMYYGVLQGVRKLNINLKDIIDEFYDGRIYNLLMPLNWGGYDSKDGELVKKIGLQYRTFKAFTTTIPKEFSVLSNYSWVRCNPTSHLEAYAKFIEDNKAFVEEVCELYSSRWDGSVVCFEEHD